MSYLRNRMPDRSVFCLIFSRDRAEQIVQMLHGAERSMGPGKPACDVALLEAASPTRASNLRPRTEVWGLSLMRFRGSLIGQRACMIFPRAKFGSGGRF